MPIDSSIQRAVAACVLAAGLVGCAQTQTQSPAVTTTSTVAMGSARDCDALRAEILRHAEADRAAQLEREIARLQADLETAESALVEAESGLAENHTRADAVSSLAVTRIELERAASRAPWRHAEVAKAATKLDEAERQISDGRYGAALFFVYRARRVAESIVVEADQVMQSSDALQIRPDRVNLRAGPSTDDPVIEVLSVGTPVIEQTREGDWVLVKVTGGPVGWVHRQLLEAIMSEGVGTPRDRGSDEVDSRVGPAAPAR